LKAEPSHEISQKRDICTQFSVYVLQSSQTPL
jgi:hypothetical protein